MKCRVPALVVCSGFLLANLFASRTYNRYALILEDPPVTAATTLRAGTPEAESRRTRISQLQARLRSDLESRNIAVTGSVEMLLNAVFVQATPDREPELRALSGVKRVVFMPRVRRKLDRAAQLVNAPAAWNALGGVGNAGLGVKVGILDTGIDQNHPAFQDNSLPSLPGFPICQPQDCAFTNKKVIVARSYVKQLSAGSSSDPAADSRPDDNSPRDRVGHGTATAMIVAGQTNTGPAATITGIAPKAYLGNYKVFGSPGVNDFTSGDVIILALEDALNDGMDIVSLSLGSPALSGPLDQGAVCGEQPGTPCDPEAQAVENAIKAGMTSWHPPGMKAIPGARFPRWAQSTRPVTRPMRSPWRRPPTPIRL